MENTNAALQALNALRSCAADTEQRISTAKQNQRRIEEIIAVLESEIVIESQHSATRRILAEAAAGLVRAVASLEGYCTIMSLQEEQGSLTTLKLPVKTRLNAMLRRPHRTSPVTPPLGPLQCVCGQTFTPRRSNQIHCSPQCRVRSYWTRWQVVARREQP